MHLEDEETLKYKETLVDKEQTEWAKKMVVDDPRFFVSAKVSFHS